MNEKIAKKLSKLLAKAGLEEDQIDGIIEEVEEVIAEEGAQDSDNPEENPVPPSDENGQDEPTEVDGQVPPTDEGNPVPTEEDVPPQEGDGSIAAALDELAAQEGAVPPEEVPPAPAAPTEGPVQTTDPSQVEQLVNDLGEANKTIEALTARIDSLEQALKDAGVITSESRVGDETPRITPNASAGQEDAFDDILSVINGK